MTIRAEEKVLERSGCAPAGNFPTCMHGTAYHSLPDILQYQNSMTFSNLHLKHRLQMQSRGQVHLLHLPRSKSQLLGLQQELEK